MLRFDFQKASDFQSVSRRVNENLNQAWTECRLQAFRLPTYGMVGLAGQTAGSKLKELNESLHASCLFLGSVNADLDNVVAEAGYLKRDVEMVAFSVGADCAPKADWSSSSLVVEPDSLPGLEAYAQSISTETLAGMARTLSSLQEYLQKDMLGDCEALSKQMATQNDKLVAMSRALGVLAANASSFEGRYGPNGQGGFASDLFGRFVSSVKNSALDLAKNTCKDRSKMFCDKVAAATKQMELNDFVSNYSFKSGGNGAGFPAGVSHEGLAAENERLNVQSAKDAGAAKALKYGSKAAGAAGVALSGYDLYDTYTTTYDEFSYLPEQDRVAYAAADTTVEGANIIISTVVSAAVAGAVTGAIAGAPVGGVGSIPGALVGACAGALAGFASSAAFDAAVNSDLNNDGVTPKEHVRKSFAGSHTYYDIPEADYLDPYGFVKDQ